MRLKPPVSEAQAMALLRSSAELSWGEAPGDDLVRVLEGIARSMAVVSALEIPDDVEPLFGEDIATAGEARP